MAFGGDHSLKNMLEEDKQEEMVGGVVDEQLAEVVLVKKHEMEEWQKR